MSDLLLNNVEAEDIGSKGVAETQEQVEGLETENLTKSPICNEALMLERTTLMWNESEWNFEPQVGSDFNFDDISQTNYDCPFNYLEMVLRHGKEVFKFLQKNY
jgi:hypothetical protein